jgi:hypothetical protein
MMHHDTNNKVSSSAVWWLEGGNWLGARGLFLVASVLFFIASCWAMMIQPPSWLLAPALHHHHPVWLAGWLAPSSSMFVPGWFTSASPMGWWDSLQRRKREAKFWGSSCIFWYKTKCCCVYSRFGYYYVGEAGLAAVGATTQHFKPILPKSSPTISN